MNIPIKSGAKYKSPTICLEQLTLETCIANSSAKLVLGNGDDNNFTPEYENWMEENQSQNIDF